MLARRAIVTPDPGYPVCGRSAKLAAAAMAFCISVLWTGSVIADEVKPEADPAAAGPEQAKSAFEKHLRAAGEYHRQRLHLAMELRSDEISQAVQLNAGQRKKISIAAKGAVNRVIDRWLEDMLRNTDFGIQFGQMQAEHAKASLIGMGEEIDVGQVVAEELWKKGVAQEFNQEQKERYKKMIAARQAFRRKVSIGQLVVVLDEKLRFNDRQRAEMNRMFDEVLPEKFTFQADQDFGGMVAQAFQIRVAGGGVVVAGGEPDPFAAPAEAEPASPLEKVPAERIAKLLTENQMKTWKVLRSNPNSLLSWGGSGHGWGGNGGGFDPAVIHWGGRVEVE